MGNRYISYFCLTTASTYDLVTGKKNRHKSGNVPTSFDGGMELDFCFTVLLFFSISVDTLVMAARALKPNHCHRCTEMQPVTGRQEQNRFRRSKCHAGLHQIYLRQRTMSNIISTQWLNHCHKLSNKPRLFLDFLCTTRRIPGRCLHTRHDAFLPQQLFFEFHILG